MDWPSLLRRLALVLALLAATARGADTPELLLEVRLGQHLLSDAMPAYQQGNDVLLPLGELARMLTIAVRVDAQAGLASGYILDPQRGFRLDLGAHTVWLGEQRLTFDPALVRREGGDIYVASALLAAWLPLGFECDLASLSLRVTAHAKLPLQARLERQASARPAPSAMRADPGYPHLATPYQLASMPFIDQTVGVDLRRTQDKRSTTTSLTSYLTADLLGAQAALYINTGQQARGPAARLTVGRHDPDGMLLGPLHARSVQAGSVVAPGVPNIALGNASGNGVLLSNRPLGQPLGLERHTLQGDLAPGWDVELYFNGALIGLQQARPDGRYSFDDLSLIYGANEFRLVFHGPLGQLRVERHSILLDQSMLAPGALWYSVAAQRDGAGHLHSLAQFEWGIDKRLSASAGVVANRRRYLNLGLQAYLDSVILNAAMVRADDGGALAQLALRTRILGLAVSASRAWARAFSSELFDAGEPLRSRDELRVDGQLATLALALQARRERLEWGPDKLELGARVSAWRYGTALSNALHWQSQAGRRQADGVLQASRRVAGIGISGQLQYTLAPDAALTSIAVAADRHLGQGYLLNLGLARSAIERRYRASAGLTKSMGSFGLGVNAWRAGRRDYGLGLQLFIGAGQEPRRAHWMTDAAPMAASGSASLRVFLDKNRNGILDGDDTPISGAGFLVNGASQLARSGEDGIAWIGRLPPNQHLDLALDPATLEDPQWVALRPGVRIVPRPGKASELDFAVGVSGEIDGTTWLLANGVKRPAGDLELQLVDSTQTVVAGTTSGADGYYVLTAVAPGRYQLRIAPAQLARLQLRAPAPRTVIVDAEGSFVSGQDFSVTAQP
jgi:hypothetical protein